MRHTHIIVALLIAGLSVPALAQYTQQQGSQQQDSQYDRDTNQPYQQDWQQQRNQSQLDQRRQQQDEQRMRQDSQWQQQTQQDQQRFGQGQQRSVSGQLIDYRTISLRDEQERHVLARIRTDEGQTVVVDLGPQSELRSQGVQLTRNQRISVQGSSGRINDSPILVVTRVQQGSRTANLQRRDLQQRRWQARQQQGSGQQGDVQVAEGLYMVYGRITRLQNVQLSGIPQGHRLIQLQTQAGRTYTIDLGRSPNLQDVQLEQGDSIAAVGRFARVNGQPVIIAQQLADFVALNQGGQMRSLGQQDQMMPTGTQQQRDQQYDWQREGAGTQQQQQQRDQQQDRSTDSDAQDRDRGGEREWDFRVDWD